LNELLLLGLNVPEENHERPENTAQLDHFALLLPDRLECGSLLFSGPAQMLNKK